MKIFKLFENEITGYLTNDVEISEGYRFSQYKLIKRIVLFANNIYPKGKVDKQGDYKYWVDIISPRIDGEVKNIDFDTKDIVLYSDSKQDNGVMLLCNLALRNMLRDSGKAEEINDAIEEGSGWGNVVWKKIKNDFEKADLKNFYVINQTAKTLEDSPVIERHILTQSYLRAKVDTWKDIDKVINSCGNKQFSATPQGISDNKEIPYYEIFERNGEVSEDMLFEAQGKEGGDEKKYILAKIICAGLKAGSTDGRHVLYAKEIPEMPYREFHRGRYNGRWFRIGIYELLFDIQTRANEISNQIAKGLKWASKLLMKSNDPLLRRNILKRLNSGAIIKTNSLEQVDVRMRGLDQLIADWNRLMTTADRLCNSYEVVMGNSMPANTSFKLGAMVNQNAGKLFIFIRQKLSLSLQSVIQDWSLDDILRDLKRRTIIRLTGDEDNLIQLYEIMVNGWYLNNLISFPPHSKEQAEMIKQTKLQEVLQSPTKYIKLEKGWLRRVKPRVTVVIAGENTNLVKDLETISSFIQLEQDPVRRTALIEKAMRMKGINIAELPKTETPQMPIAAPAIAEEEVAAV